MDIPIYSPTEEINHPILKEKQVRLWLKRDDMIHPFISGNKWRKLKYILAKARSEQKQHLVTFGGAWSNHLLATACAAAKFGFKSTGFVRGEEVDNSLLSLCKMFGMELLFVDRASYRDKQKLFSESYSSDRDAYFIDEGGASPEAVKGCEELIAELDEEYDHIFCACGTGTTAAGIINGLAAARLNSRFHGIPVFKEGSFIRQEISKYLVHPADFRLHLDYHFGGYGKTNGELMDFIKSFSSSTGILLDPVYTGKVLYGVFDLASKNYFISGSKILVIHTGGLIGLLGKL